MSRYWHRVSRSIQKLAAGMYPIASEGMSPYEMYYVLGTDEEIRCLELNATQVFTDQLRFEEARRIRLAI